MKPVLIFVAEVYNGKEFSGLRDTLKANEIKFQTLGSSEQVEDEYTRRKGKCTHTLSEAADIDVTEFSGLAFVSAAPQIIRKYWTDSAVIDLVDRFHKASKPLAAICCAVPVLSHVATGKSVSVYPIIETRQFLESHGVEPLNVSLHVDAPFVTAENYAVAKLWAEAFVQLLKGETPNISLTPGVFQRVLKPRKDNPYLETAKQLYVKRDQGQ